MDNQQLREQFATELRRQRLPVEYIERLLAEFDDHLTDFQEERDAAMQQARKPQASQVDVNSDSVESAVIDFTSRLGDPKSLGRLAAEQYYSRSFLGRHPILTFLVLPLPLVCVQLVAVVCLMSLPYLIETALGIDLIGGLNAQHAFAGALLLTVASALVVLAPPLIVGLLMCRIARKNRLDWRWSAAACTLIALHSALFFVSWQLAVAPGEGRFMIGFTVTGSASWILTQFLPKFCTAMAIGALLVIRSRQLQGPADDRNNPPLLRAAA